MQKQTLKVFTHHLHLDDGEVVPATLVLTAGQPLEIFINIRKADVDIDLPPKVHVMLGWTNNHAHFREDRIPKPEEYEEHKLPSDIPSYEELLRAILAANAAYDVYRGSLASLHGGISTVACQGNTPYGPKTLFRWQKWLKHCRKKALVNLHGWPRMDPDGGAIPGQRGKDFADTFGGRTLSLSDRERMYVGWEDVGYHNDEVRPGISLADFAEQYRDPVETLHARYFDNDCVLSSQRKVFDLARKTGVKNLTTLHIPTGPALQHVLSQRGTDGITYWAEVSLEHTFIDQDWLTGNPMAEITFRRPAHATREHRLELIELLLMLARKRDPHTYTADDQAPHQQWLKRWLPKGLPSVPGTRASEHWCQYLMALHHEHGFTLDDINWIAGVVPIRHLAQYMQFDYPVGTVTNGAMANLVMFDPNALYQEEGLFPVNPNRLAQVLHDPHYHTPLTYTRGLRGRVHYTVVDGRVYEIGKTAITALN